MANFNKVDVDRSVTTQKKAPFAYQGKRKRRDPKEALTPGATGTLRNNLHGNFGVEGYSVARGNGVVFTERLLVPFKGKQFSSVERQAVRQRREIDKNIGFTIQGLLREKESK